MDCLSMQKTLLGCKIISQDRMTDTGWHPAYYLLLGDRAFELGGDKRFADSLAFALERNARSFEREERVAQRMGHFVSLAWAVVENKALPPELRAQAEDLVTLKQPTLTNP